MSSKNPYLSYELQIGLSEHPKLKHIITNEELKKFIKFLNSKKLYMIIYDNSIEYAYAQILIENNSFIKAKSQ